MQCKLYKNVCCILTDIITNEPSDYCCHDCLIHIAVEQDKQIDDNDNNIN